MHDTVITRPAQVTFEVMGKKYGFVDMSCSSF
jgi:hypothetical protein